MEKIFAGKVALVTGGSFGIGRATAVAFAKRGANVVVADWVKDHETIDLVVSEGVKAIFVKYLSIDVTEGWNWNHYDTTRVRSELNKIAKKRGDIAHRSWRPVAGQPTPHAVTRDDLRKSIRFIKNLVAATDAFISEQLYHLRSHD